MKSDQDKFRAYVSQTIIKLSCQELFYNKQLKVQGLLGITIDESEVFIVHINECLDEKFGFINYHSNDTNPITDVCDNMHLSTTSEVVSESESSNSNRVTIASLIKQKNIQLDTGVEKEVLHNLENENSLQSNWITNDQNDFTSFNESVPSLINMIQKCIDKKKPAEFYAHRKRKRVRKDSGQSFKSHMQTSPFDHPYSSSQNAWMTIPNSLKQEDESESSGPNICLPFKDRPTLSCLDIENCEEMEDERTAIVREDNFLNSFPPNKDCFSELEMATLSSTSKDMNVEVIKIEECRSIDDMASQQEELDVQNWSNGEDSFETKPWSDFLNGLQLNGIDSSTVLNAVNQLTGLDTNSVLTVVNQMSTPESSQHMLTANQPNGLEGNAMYTFINKVNSSFYQEIINNTQKQQALLKLVNQGQSNSEIGINLSSKGSEEIINSSRHNREIRRSWNTKNKPYVCDHEGCERSYFFVHDLKRHLRQKHGGVGASNHTKMLSHPGFLLFQ